MSNIPVLQFQKKKLNTALIKRMSTENKTVDINLTGTEFARLANNFYNSLGMESYQGRINIDAQFVNYFLANANKVKEKKKVAFVWICLNPPYWEFAKPMVEGAKQFFLPGHDVDYFLWSDMPETKEDITNQVYAYLEKVGMASVVSAEPKTLNLDTTTLEGVKKLAEDIESLYKMEKVKIFPTESIEWPMPTLMRYHTFLQQEEILKEYDYIFYCDVDMMFVDIVGDEILGKGLTTGTNPMYFLDKSMYPPYEPNPKSAAYIPRPGQVVNENGKPRFMPQYYAGGFQGGKADQFIEAMKGCKKIIDHDMMKINYIPIWNDESAWNRYLFDHPENLIVLNPSYIYPDSLQKEYYEPRWGRAYQPKLVTLTKKFSLKQLTPEEQQQIMLMKPK